MSASRSWDEVNEEFLAPRWRGCGTGWRGSPGGPATAPGERAAEEPGAPRRARRGGDGGVAARRSTRRPRPSCSSERLGLRRFERDVLLLCAAVELDPSIPALLRRGPRRRRRCRTRRSRWRCRCSTTHRGTRSRRAAACATGGCSRSPRRAGQPLTSSALRADERDRQLPQGPELPGRPAGAALGAVDAPALADLPPSQQRAGRRGRAGAGTGPSDGAIPPVVQLIGPDPPSKRWSPRSAAAMLGRSLHALPAELLPPRPRSSRTWPACGTARACSCRSRCTSTPRGRLAHGATARATPSPASWQRSDGVMFLGTREVWVGVPRERAPFDVERPTPAEQRAAWEAGARADAARLRPPTSSPASST